MTEKEVTFEIGDEGGGVSDIELVDITMKEAMVTMVKDDKTSTLLGGRTEDESDL